MPKISRIRIINFSYNGDKRLILDELFNLHQGKDALISLKNGGGKSVLVQALMQPILPNVMLQKRKMSDFFVRKKQPAYILIEWKLDQEGGSFLTGIAMTSKESTFQEQEEGTHAIRFFTFTTSYLRSDEFDIRHLPLTTKENNRVMVMNYGEAQKLLQEAAKKRGGSVHYFSEHEKRAYQEHLESHNLYPDEWKSMLLPVNSEEGGLIKIFEKCRTSRMLLREWILPTVNKVIFDNAEEAQSLQQMMGNLAQSMIENESFLLEKELLHGFSGKLELLRDDACKAAETQTLIREKEEELRSLEQFLHGELRRLKEAMEETQRKLEEEKAELKRIDQEKSSEDYYVAEENYEKSRVKTEELQKAHQSLEEKLEKVAQEILLLEARQLYEELQEISGKKAAVETELSRLNAPSEDQEMRDRVAYSLKLAYGSLLQETEAKHRISEETWKTKKVRKTANGEERQRGKAEENDLKDKQYEIRKEIEAYEAVEKELTQRLGLGIQRNLMGGLDESLAKSFLEKLKKGEDDLQRELTKTVLAIQDVEEEQETIREEIPNLRMGMMQKQKDLDHLKVELQVFRQKEEELLRCLNRYGINPRKRFQKDDLLQELKSHRETFQEKLDGHKAEIRSLEKRRTALESGTLHVSKEFQDHLKAYDIDFETGESYLQRHGVEIRQKLLESIPLLPYAFLMTEEEMKKVREQRPERPLLQPVPILTYGSLEGEGHGEKNIVTVGAGKIILCAPDLQLFESGGLEAYRERLMKLLKAEEESKAHYEAYLQDLQNDEQVVQRFSYPEDYELKAKKNEDALLEELQGLTDREGALRKRQDTLKGIKHQLEEQKGKLGKGKEEAQKNVQDVELHLSKNPSYELLLQQRNELETKSQRLEKRLQELEREAQDLTDEISRLAMEIRWMEEQQEKIKKDILPFEQAGEKPLEEGTLEELLAKYRTYAEKLDGNIGRLQKELQELESRIRASREKLQEKGVLEEEYLNIIYSKAEVQRLKAGKRSLEGEVKQKWKLLDEANRETAKLEGIRENVQQTLREKSVALLERQDIHGNYGERTKQCKAAIKGWESKLTDLDRTVREDELIQRRIGEQLRESKIKVTMKIWPGNREVEAGYEAVSRELTEVVSKLSKEKNKLQQSFMRLRADYLEKDPRLSMILHTFDKSFEAADKDSDNFYYLYENTEENLKTLKNLIQLNEAKLENMEKSVQDTVVQSYYLAKEVYDHVNRITDDSSIHLDGRSRKVKMIEILLRELEPEEKGRDAMQRYVKERADEVKEQLKAGKTKKEVQELIAKYMSSEELLNVISDLSDLRIKAYKVDINAKHSQAKDWEKVMKENSGGERFVSFFAVMIALMSFARNRRRQVQDYGGKNKDSKVLLMDNPFGPISSEHLLKPLFVIADKYNTQLICLTDLKQNSIMNQFKVIFMMKIVPNTSGTMEYLKVEESTIDGDEDTLEENLEMLNYHYQNVEQMSMLGDETE